MDYKISVFRTDRVEYVLGRKTEVWMLCFISKELWLLSREILKTAVRLMVKNQKGLPINKKVTLSI